MNQLLMTKRQINKRQDMIEERREFIEGFMAAAMIFGVTDFDKKNKMLDIDLPKNVFRESL